MYTRPFKQLFISVQNMCNLIIIAFKIHFRNYCKALFFISFFLMFSCEDSDDNFSYIEVKTFPDRKQDFSLWQLQQFDYFVQMAYIIRADDGTITVIDGGMPDSAMEVENYLVQFGGIVDTWIITHPHGDHGGVLVEVLEKKRIKIKRIMHISLEENWVEEHEKASLPFLSKYNRALKESKVPVLEVKKKDVFLLGDGIELKILSGRNETITVNPINNSSLVFTVKSKSKTILFLGDLGVEGGNALLLENNIEDFRADYVQMAHHGQNGVGLEFYKAVQADYALWPTPKWLWENRAQNQGPGTGNFQTPEVRAWTENELGIKKNYVAGLVEGNIQID